MEIKMFKIQNLEATDEGVFQGYAAIFNNVDLGGDRILPGAFKKTLNDKGGKVPLVDSHDLFAGTTKRLGVAYLEEDEKGLKVVKGKLNLAKPEAVNVLNDIKFYQNEGLPLGLSIGYEPINPTIICEKDRTIRELKEVALWEVSVVTLPMNPKARILNAKTLSALLAPQEAADLSDQSPLEHDLGIKSKIEEIQKLRKEFENGTKRV